MYTVTFFEVYCDDGIPEATTECFQSYREALNYMKSFEDWDDVRVQYIDCPVIDDCPF